MPGRKERKMFDEGVVDRCLVSISEALEKEVEAYLLGGHAMMKHNAKAATKDVDLVFKDKEDAQTFVKAARMIGYEDIEIPLEYQDLGSRFLLENDDGIRLDIFVVVVCNALEVSDGMRSRAKVWVLPGRLRVLVASLEDIFLLKSITTRDDDLVDMQALQAKGLDWDIVAQEAHAQKDSWKWLGRLYSRLLDFEEAKGIKSPLIERLAPKAEIIQAMGIVIDKLETGPMTKGSIKVLLQEDEMEFVENVIRELKKRRLVRSKNGKIFRK